MEPRLILGRLWGRPPSEYGYGDLYLKGADGLEPTTRDGAYDYLIKAHGQEAFFKIVAAHAQPVNKLPHDIPQLNFVHQMVARWAKSRFYDTELVDPIYGKLVSQMDAEFRVPEFRLDGPRVTVAAARDYLKAEGVFDTLAASYRERTLLDRNGKVLPKHRLFDQLFADDRAAPVRAQYDPLASRATDPPGFIYIVSNPLFPGILKIGKAVDVASRIKGLNTGVPADYKLEHSQATKRPTTLERLVHDRLRAKRVQREFFKATVGEAKHALHFAETALAKKHPED